MDEVDPNKAMYERVMKQNTQNNTLKHNKIFNNETENIENKEDMIDEIF